MKLESSRQIFEESSNIKFHENPPNGSLIVTSGQSDMTQLTVVFTILRQHLKRINWYDHLRSVPAAKIRMCLNITVYILFLFSSSFTHSHIMKHFVSQRKYSYSETLMQRS